LKQFHGAPALAHVEKDLYGLGDIASAGKADRGFK